MSFNSKPEFQPYFGYCRILEVSPALALVSPFCGNGTIIEYLQKRPDLNRFHLVITIAPPDLSEPFIFRQLQQVASGLKYLHDHDVVHADLSGNNVLIDDEGNARLSDFGRARLLDAEGFITSLFAGSVDFVAPELFTQVETEGRADNSDFSTRSDVYAFAMLTFQVRYQRDLLSRNVMLSTFVKL